MRTVEISKQTVEIVNLKKPLTISHPAITNAIKLKAEVETALPQNPAFNVIVSLSSNAMSQIQALTSSIFRQNLKPRALSQTLGQTFKMSTNTESTPASAPWHAAFPAPKSEVTTITREEVLGMLKTTPLGQRDFVLVDLRRNDFEVSY